MAKSLPQGPRKEESYSGKLPHRSRFESVDKVTNESYGIFEAEYSRFIVLGETPKRSTWGMRWTTRIAKM